MQQLEASLADAAAREARARAEAEREAAEAAARAAALEAAVSEERARAAEAAAEADGSIADLRRQAAANLGQPRQTSANLGNLGKTWLQAAALGSQHEVAAEEAGRLRAEVGRLQVVPTLTARSLSSCPEGAHLAPP